MKSVTVDKMICNSTSFAQCVKLVRNSDGTAFEQGIGFHCVNDKCVKCPIGSFGPDGEFCKPCPFATWSPNTGQATCDSTFSFSTEGQHNVYIPFGVSKILVSLWGAGGGGDKSVDTKTFVAHSGGGGGYASCTVSVDMSKNAYVIVAGGGSASSSTINIGGG